MKQCYQQSIEDILFDAIRDKAKDDYFIGSMDNLKKEDTKPYQQINDSGFATNNKRWSFVDL